MNNDTLITKEYVGSLIKKREVNTHKGSYGKVIVFAGSSGMAGAAVLCARGTLRAGAGLVKVCIEESLFPIVQIGIPEATCISREKLLEEIKHCDAIVIGPGLGESEATCQLIKSVLENTELPVVLDADGLNLLKNNLDSIKNSKARIVVTPHPGEAARLLKWKTEEVNRDRHFSAKELAEKTGAVAVLKGAGTIVASCHGNTYVNSTGNPGMATGGSGDVLAGVIGALAAQGLSTENAAIAGVYIHGFAGDLGSDTMGEYGLIASDIANMVAMAMKKLGGERENEK